MQPFVEAKRCATWGKLPVPKNKRFVGKRNRFAAFLRKFPGCEGASKTPNSGGEEQKEEVGEKHGEEKKKEALPKRKKCILFKEMHEDNQSKMVSAAEKKAAMKAIDEQCAALNEMLAPELDLFMEARTSRVELSQDFWKNDTLFVVLEKKANSSELESECILLALTHTTPIPTPMAVVPDLPQPQPYDPLARDMPMANVPPELLDRCQRLKNLLMDKDRLRQQQKLVHLVAPDDPLEATFLPKLEHRSGGKDMETLEKERELLLENENCSTACGVKINPDSCLGRGVSHGWDSINSLQSRVSAVSSSAKTVFAAPCHAYSVDAFPADADPMDLYPADDSAEDEQPVNFPFISSRNNYFQPGEVPYKDPFRYDSDEDDALPGFLSRNNDSNKVGATNRSSNPSSSPKASPRSKSSHDGDSFATCCEVGNVKIVEVAQGQGEKSESENQSQKTEYPSEDQSQITEYHSDNQIQITEYHSEKEERQPGKPEFHSGKVKKLLAKAEDQSAGQPMARFPPRSGGDSDVEVVVKAADFGAKCKGAEALGGTSADEGREQRSCAAKKPRIPDLGSGKFVADDFAAMGIRWCRAKPMQIEEDDSDGGKVDEKPKKIISKQGDFRAFFEIDEFTLRALLWVSKCSPPGPRMESTDRITHYMEHFYWSRLTKDAPHFHWFVTEGFYPIHFLLCEKAFKEVDVMANKELDKEVLEYIKAMNQPGGERLDLTEVKAYFMVTSYFNVLHARASQKARSVEDRFLLRCRFAVTVLETYFQEQGLRPFQGNLNCAELLTWSLKHEGRLFAINEEALEYAADRGTIGRDSMVMRTPNQEAFKDFYERHVMPRPDALAINPCLRSIRRYPSENLDDKNAFSCPIKGCGMDLVSSQLMSHFLTDHCRRIEELWLKDRMVLLFYPRSYPTEQLYCICVVALRPVRQLSGRKMDVPELILNEELPPRLYYFSVHVPCLLMYCQVSQTIVRRKRRRNADGDQGEKKHKKSDPSANDSEAQLYVFWLASNENREFSDMACRLYIYCQDRSVKSHSLVNFVVMSQFKGIEDLVNNHPDSYLALDQTTMVSLTKNFKELVFIDVRYVNRMEFDPDMSGDESWDL